MTLIDNSIPLEQVAGDVLHIRYVPLSAFDLDVQLWEENSKLHDLQLLEESILEYGYADCAKWDSQLNGGRGGFVYGNGRSEALIVKLYRMQLAGEDPPRGIGANRETGEWVIPVKFGVDTFSEAQATAFGFSHNILTVQAGDVSPADIAKIFSPEFSSQLQEMADAGEALPVGFDGDYLDSLLRYEQLSQEESLAFDSGGEEGNSYQPPEEYSGKSERTPIERTCPSCGHHWSGRS